MSDEITVTTALRVKNGSLEQTGKTYQTKFTQTTGRAGSFTVDVGTTEESIAFGDIVPGFVRLTNLDPTNFVEVGFSTGVYGMRLSAVNGVCMFERKSGANVYVKSDTAACKIQVEAINV
jgi:hypothetical protein